MPEFSTTHVDSTLGGKKMPLGSYANFAECVAANRGKVNDPEAYCGTIKKKVEGEEINVVNEVLMSLGHIDDDGVLRGAQLMPIGEWNHPLGKIKVTPERARRFAEQFKQNVTGQNLPVLWIHSDPKNVANPQYGKAAGWMTEVRADDKLGVLVDIKFSPEGVDAVSKKEYAYLSAEYFDQVQLPHHETPQEDVIVAAALVNRPHLKGMNPLLNEETGHQFLLGKADHPIEGGSPMDPFLRQLAEQAKIILSDDQSELTEDQQKQLDEFFKGIQEAAAKVPSLEKQLAETEDQDKAKARNLQEAGFTEEAALLSEYRADKMVKQLGEFVETGKALSPAVQVLAREYALEQTPEKLLALHKGLLSKSATVDMRELGRSGEDEDDTESSTELADKILGESAKLALEHKIDIGQAMSMYSLEHPDEWNEYQKSLGADMAKIEGR